MTLDRLAFGCLLMLAVCLGLGDIARVSPFAAALLTGLRALLPLAIGLALLAALRQHRLPAFPSRLAAPTLAWLAVLVASTAFAPSNRLDALASLERPASGALLAWAVSDLCRTRARWRLLARAAALGGLTIALAGLAEASGIPAVQTWLAGLHEGALPIGDVPRIAATLSHPNEAALLLELSLPLLVAWAWTAPRPWRAPLALGVAGNLVAMVLTFSRAGLVAGTAALAVMAGLCVVRGERKLLLGLAAGVLAVPIALSFAAAADQGLDRRLTAELASRPLAITQPADPGLPALAAQPARPDPARVQLTRMQYWTAALRMLRDQPLLGVGPDNFRWRFASYAGVPADNLGIHAHNQYLEALADSGVLGLLSLGWLLATLVRMALERAHQRCTPSVDWAWRAAIVASLSAWLLHALLDDLERFWPASVAFWLLTGLNVCSPDRAVGPVPSRTQPRVSTVARRLAVEEPPRAGDDGHYHQQDEDAPGRRQRGATTATAAKTDHAAYCSTGEGPGAR